MPNADLLFTRLSPRLDDACWERVKSRLPEHLRDRVHKYKRWRDRHRYVAGILLLEEGLRRLEYDVEVLNDFGIGNVGRPYIPGVSDFNSSHSGEFVVCCIAGYGKVGIDVERIRQFDFSAFEPHLHPETWCMIEQAANPTTAFFDAWTKVESVLKADGRGFSAEPSAVRLARDSAELDGVRWYLHSINLDEDYRCSVATSQDDVDLRIAEVQIYELAGRGANL